MLSNMFQIWLIFSSCLLMGRIFADNPCAPRDVGGESVVCVCNSTYCDFFTAVPPTKGHYVAYTSSKAGSRFVKSSGDLRDESDIKSTCCNSIDLEIDPDTQFQTIEGFGGAVTDAAGINWKSLSELTQNSLILSYCSDSGLKYNLLRVPIGGCDFSTRVYTYQDSPEDDKDLTNFTLAPEDVDYKIPMIKACMNAASGDIQTLGSTWSPPVWMKTNGKITGSSRLKTEYYDAYALYHLKFLEAYKEYAIPIWAITTTNEPLNGVIPLAKFNSLGWTPSKMAQWIVGNLGPKIRNSEFKDIKILTCDDQRFAIPIWFNKMIAANKTVLDYIDGVAVHFYWDNIVPAAVLKFVTYTYPSKFLLATEACEGSNPWDKGVKLGSWSRAVDYAKDIIEDLVNFMVGWIDWNLCLNSRGGPNWSQNFVDSPVIVFGDKDEFYKQPMFYALGHFSKFIPRNSKRVAVKKNSWFSMDNVAVVTPNGTVVVVLYNGGWSKKVRLQIKDKAVQLDIEADSITTVEMLL